MSDQLSQEEIDRMLSGGADPEPAEPETEVVDALTQQQTDIIGEVGNISMSQAATALSQNLNHQVLITTPRVACTTFEKIIAQSTTPKVVTTVEFKAGLTGTNMLMMDTEDATVIADLMMGGSGDVQKKELTELELSAVKEVMNQMIGSASTAMATMIGETIDIHPPNVSVWSKKEDIDEKLIPKEETICKIAFNLEVEGVLHSEIMQVFSLDTVYSIEESVLSDKAEIIERYKEKVNQPESTEEEQKAYEAPIKEKAVTIQKPTFQQLSDNPSAKANKNLDLIMDVPLDFSVVLGESKKTIKDILSLGTGSVVELNKMTDEPLEIYVNGKLIAEGEVVVINESFGVRITNILSQEQRVNNL
ncbi:MAG: flagellar motor switch phosphatase FliY [Pisciglobus halotolerans]|nr:flagellar motor switch phosphatase FliY [Pisciglobus halotolerans]